MATTAAELTLPEGLTQFSLPPPSPRSPGGEASGELSLPSLDINSSSLYNFLGLPPPSPNDALGGPVEEDKENAPIARSSTGDPLRSPAGKSRLPDRLSQNTPPSSFSGVRPRRKAAASSTPRSSRARPLSISSIRPPASVTSADATLLSARSARRNSAELSAWAAVGSEFGQIPDAEAAGVGWQKEVAEEMVRLSLGRSGFMLPQPARAQSQQSRPASPPATLPTAATPSPAKVRLAPDTPSRPRWADFLFPSPAPAPPSLPSRTSADHARPDGLGKPPSAGNIPRSVSGPAVFGGKPTVRLVSGSGGRSVSVPLGVMLPAGVPSIGVLPASPVPPQGENERVSRSATLPTYPAPTAAPRPTFAAQRASWSSFASSGSSLPRSSMSRSRSEVLSQPSQELSYAGFWNRPSLEQSRQEERVPRRLSMREVLAPRPVVVLTPAEPRMAEVRRSRPPSSQSLAGGRTSRASRTSMHSRPGSRLSFSEVRDSLRSSSRLDRRSTLRNKEFRTDLEAVEDSRLYEKQQVPLESAEEKECARLKRIFLFGFLAFPLWWMGCFTRSAVASAASTTQKSELGEAQEWKVWQGRCRAAAAISTFLIVMAVVLALVFALH
ncbi:hypothetical protein CALCODRAFT_519976 [Calocera cornea HHB12733]|uniref:Uncharacterized protein n=1 Tax=Calocera cornea HHB12733 TaxID=1353952 RepID=A0A165DU57_9BASI|nr:hypothetical protein CALCODRAFT_519976 [Calocera cornea HHB12733]